MIVTQELLIPASPAQVCAYMNSVEYLDALKQALDIVSKIELVSLEEKHGALERVVRYEAPTEGKIPGFLQRYQDKAPAFVRWEERGQWDASRSSFSYTIVPDVPEHWHKRYKVRGTLSLQAAAGGSTKQRASLEYEIKVLGFSTIIEKALKPEVEKILRIQAEVGARGFAT